MVNSYPAAFGYTLYTVSAWENDQQAATGGVGLVLGKTSHDKPYALIEMPIEVSQENYQELSDLFKDH